MLVLSGAHSYRPSPLSRNRNLSNLSSSIMAALAGEQVKFKKTHTGFRDNQARTMTSTTSSWHSAVELLYCLVWKVQRAKSSHGASTSSPLLFLAFTPLCSLCTWTRKKKIKKNSADCLYPQKVNCFHDMRPYGIGLQISTNVTLYIFLRTTVVVWMTSSISYLYTKYSPRSSLMSEFQITLSSVGNMQGFCVRTTIFIALYAFLLSLS